MRLVTSLEGLSADGIALILAIGLVLGTFPIYGLPTILCALAGLVLGLNLPALQLVNQLVTPLQLILLVPFARVGARIMNSPGSATPLAWGLGAAALHAVTGWLCLCLPLGILVYFALGNILRRFSARPFLQTRDLSRTGREPVAADGPVRLLTEVS
jgi:uncharacterized protein (DUF2062 family)